MVPWPGLLLSGVFSSVGTVVVRCGVAHHCRVDQPRCGVRIADHCWALSAPAAVLGVQGIRGAAACCTGFSLVAARLVVDRTGVVCINTAFFFSIPGQWHCCHIVGRKKRKLTSAKNT